mmetsp:Transcript_21393/g.44009  ORF Transcript_21393/g.44009 Transcript_21393/m.44009 type:complete len:130 (-) Transcript_21393:333-722(-)
MRTQHKPDESTTEDTNRIRDHRKKQRIYQNQPQYNTIRYNRSHDSRSQYNFIPDSIEKCSRNEIEHQYNPYILNVTFNIAFSLFASEPNAPSIANCTASLSSSLYLLRNKEAGTLRVLSWLSVNDVTER